MATPKCPKCEGASITTQNVTLAGTFGFYVLCAGCGAIITWVPVPKR